MECGEGEADGDEEADEEFGVVGVDAVGEDLEADAEGYGDGEDFGPGGEGLGAAGRRGAEAVAEALPELADRCGAGELLVAGSPSAATAAMSAPMPLTQAPGSRLTTPPRSYAMAPMV